LKREYFCGGCGLFHWMEQYRTDPTTGRIDRVEYEGCPNDFCITHVKPVYPFFAVDTLGWAYYSESNKEFVEKMGWSSPKYSPVAAVEIYRKQGIRIKEDARV
jgi:hypothetical protein